MLKTETAKNSFKFGFRNSDWDSEVRGLIKKEQQKKALSGLAL